MCAIPVLLLGERGWEGMVVSVRLARALEEEEFSPCYHEVKPSEAQVSPQLIWLCGGSSCRGHLTRAFQKAGGEGNPMQCSHRGCRSSAACRSVLFEPPPLLPMLFLLRSFFIELCFQKSVLVIRLSLEGSPSERTHVTSTLMASWNQYPVGPHPRHCLTAPPHPAGDPCPNLPKFWMSLVYSELYINGILKGYIFVCGFLLSPLFITFICIMYVASVRSFDYCVSVKWFTPSVDGHLGHFLNLAAKYGAPANVLVPVFRYLVLCVCISIGSVPGGKLLGERTFTCPALVDSVKYPRPM